MRLIYLLIGETYLDLPAATKIPIQEKEKMIHGRDHATNTQSQ